MKFDINKAPEFYQGYLRKAAHNELVPLLLQSGDSLMELLKSINDEKAIYRYEEGKWSIKDLVQHIIDAERVFVYRAMRFARNDKTDLPGFEQDDYVASANADNRTVHQLLTEFVNLRASTIDFFSSLSQEVRERTGPSNNAEMSIEMIGYIISGHLLHHLSIIEERYLK
ncbi:MAG: DinB family protein [Ekhidna sp.]